MACAPSGDFLRCFQCSGLQTRWAHRLQIYVPDVAGEAALRLFVVKKSRRFKFDDVRQRFRLTPTERRVALFVAAAFVLGLVTKCYRDTHPSPTPIQTHSDKSRVSRLSSAKVDQPGAPNAGENARRTRRSAEKLNLPDSPTEQDYQEK